MRPTVAIQQKADIVTLGYVEVKPPDFESNPELAFMDLVRLGRFSRRLMLRKNNRKVILVQCIGYHTVFYLVSAFTEEITQLAEILSIDVPKEIGQIGCLLQKVDDFKRLFLLYDHQIETRYKISRALEEEDVAPPIDAINPKRRKQTIPPLLYPAYNGFIKTVIYRYQYLKTAYKLWFADILIFPHLDSV